MEKLKHLSCGATLLLALVPAQVLAQSESRGPTPIVASQITDNPDDVENQLAWIEDRRRDRTGVFEVEPLGGVRRWFSDLNDLSYEATGLRMGLAFHHVFQWVDPTIDGTPNYGTTTDFDINGSWDLFNRGHPNQAKLVFHGEGRFDYDSIGPQNLGFVSLGTAGGTANSFSAYDPNMILRQLYFTQGSQEAGWSYRIGKMTVDGLPAASRHINPNATFLPNVGTGMFAAAPADSGLAFVVNYSFDESWSVLGVVSDANADRYNWGDIEAGDFWKLAELQWRSPSTARLKSAAKLAFWHSDGTKDGLPINGSTGNPGSGWSAMFETELAPDGRPVVVARYGQSNDGAAIYDKQAGLHFLLYKPAGSLRFDDDVFGAAVNWVDSATPGAREEYNFETFYRVPLFPKLDMTVSYQYIKDPAITREFDSASAFSIRLTTTF